MQDVIGQVRTMKLALEYRIGRAISEDMAIFDWICEHAGTLITRLRVGRDRRTAWERITGRPCNQPLLEFGELVWAKPLRLSAGKERRKLDLEARWFKGVWVGVHDRSNEHIVIACDGGPQARPKKGDEDGEENAG